MTISDKSTIPMMAQIEEAVQSISGWSPIDQLYTLFNLAYMHTDLAGDIVEIGSWCGRSAVVLGMAARLTGDSRLHCVDLFPAKTDWHENPDGSFSFEVTIDGKKYGGYQDQTVWREPFLRDIAPLYERYASVFDIFSESIRKNGMESIISAWKGDSSSFIKQLPNDFRCKLAFIDGDHSYDSVCRDIWNIEPYLVKGGWICFDDAFSSYEGVNRAISDCVINSGKYDHCQQMTRKFFMARKKNW